MLTQIICLATAIFFEGRSETVEAQRLIGETIVNRVSDHRYPNKICAVVHEPRQFSFTHDGRSDDIFDHLTNPREEDAALTAFSLAEEVLTKPTSITSTHYIRYDAEAAWVDVFDRDGRYGSHVFYTNSTRYR